jgi:hypothetical protein
VLQSLGTPDVAIVSSKQQYKQAVTALLLSAEQGCFAEAVPAGQEQCMVKHEQAVVQSLIDYRLWHRSAAVPWPLAQQA